jgi:hypothetical protein
MNDLQTAAAKPKPAPTLPLPDPPTVPYRNPPLAAATYLGSLDLAREVIFVDLATGLAAGVVGL